MQVRLYGRGFVEHIISSFDVFDDRFFGTALMGNAKRIDAVKKYFSMGGVIKLSSAGGTSDSAAGRGSAPKLSYPNPTTLNRQLSKLEAHRGAFEEKRKQWQRTLADTRVYFTKQNVLKLKEPLYWQHMAKMISDADYRKDANSVKLPANLVADTRWKPMVKMFVKDPEYRKQLTETVTTSIVYKKDRRVAQYASVLQDFRAGIASKKLDFLNEKIDGLDGRIATLRTMLAWARE